MLGTSRCTADQERRRKPFALHFARDVGHFIERRRNQPGEADQIGLLFDVGQVLQCIGIVRTEPAAALTELATPGDDLRRYVIYRVTVGSMAFGLSTAASDDDRRGVFLPPAAMTWSLTIAAFMPTDAFQRSSISPGKTPRSVRTTGGLGGGGVRYRA